MQIILFCPFDADVLIPYGHCWCSCAYGSHGHVHGDASLVETCASCVCTSYLIDGLFLFFPQTYFGSITYFSQLLNGKKIFKIFSYPQKVQNNPQRCVNCPTTPTLFTGIFPRYPHMHILLLKLSTGWDYLVQNFVKRCFNGLYLSTGAC